MALLLKEVYAEELSEGRKFLDINQFKKLTSPEDQTRYLADHGKKLGQGSSRTAFLINSRQVLKMARSSTQWLKNNYGEKLGKLEVGRAQNRAEVELYTQPKIKPFLAKIYDFDKDYTWIISELVRTLNGEEEFMKLTGVSWRDFTVMCHMEKPGQLELDDEKRERFEYQYRNNEFVKRFFEMLDHTDIDAGDLDTASHLGKTNDGRVVFLDYGYTDSVRDLYY